MAREFGRIRLSIADDDDFEELTPAGQWLFCRIGIPELTLTHCGRFDWRPVRLLRKARGLTVAYLEEAAADCEAARFVLFDLETEEALLRSYIRSEELLRNWKFAVAVVNAYRDLASNQLRAVVREEVRRIKVEHPEYPCWNHPEVGPQLERLLIEKAIDQVPYQCAYASSDQLEITNGQPVSNGHPEAVSIGNAMRGPDYQYQKGPDSLHLAPAPKHLAPEGLPKSGTSRAAPLDHDDGPPPKTCDRHAGHPSPPPCGACREARELAEAWEAERDQLARAEALARRARLEACQQCQGTGWLHDDDGTPVEPAVKCEHLAIVLEEADR